MRTAKLMIVPIVLSLGGTPRPAAGQALGYVERSVGLEQPGLEAGRTELEFADVNGDGHPDLVSVGDHGNPGIGSGEHGIMVWFGDGAGSWTFYQTGELGYGGLALGDVNNDGLMDIGYGIHHNYSGVDLGDQILEVALGDGSGQNWAPWDDGLATAGEDWGMFGTDFAEVDNDGDLDLGSISFGCCAGLHVYLNNGDGTWTHGWGFLGGNSNMEFAFGDVNGDGLADFAASHQLVGSGADTVYLGDGQGGFTLADGDLPPASAPRQGVSLGDVNADGRDDLAFVTGSGIGVYALVAPGHWQDLSGMLATAGDVWSTQITDMNLDGFGDVVALFEDQTVVYAGDGQGGWQESATIAHTGEPCDFAAFRAGTDVDHNGYPDLVRATEENCSWWTGGTNRLHVLVEDSIPTQPFVHLVRPRGGETWLAGSVRFIDWHAAVPEGLGSATVSIAVSVSGPAGPFVTVAEGAPNSGRYQWTVPGTWATSEACHVRVTLDTDPGAEAVSPAAFRILGAVTPAVGDLNCDGVVNAFDIDPFVLALTDAAGFAAAYPGCNMRNADVNGDGEINAFDIDPFVALLTGG